MRFATLGLLAFALLSLEIAAETPVADSGPMVRFTATTANVAGAPDWVGIDLFRWSTDAERDKLMAAWDLKPGAVGRGNAAGGRGGGGRGAAGRGAPAGGRGGRGGTGAASAGP